MIPPKLNLAFCVFQVVEGDKVHIGRLLQLILGVAINCGEQAEYIQKIMEMEEDVQRVLMLAIQVINRQSLSLVTLIG